MDDLLSQKADKHLGLWEGDQLVELHSAIHIGSEGDAPQAVRGIVCSLTVRWEKVTSETARDGNMSLYGATSRLPCQLSHLPRYPYINRHGALELEELGDVDVGERLPKACQSAPHFATASVRKKRRAVIPGDSVLRGTEHPVCHSDPSHSEVYCLPGVRVRDVARNISCLVKFSDYDPLLVFHIENEEVGKISSWVIKRDFRALGSQL